MKGQATKPVAAPRSRTHWSQRFLSRRAWLRASWRAGVGAVAFGMVGCSDDDDDAAEDASLLGDIAAGTDASQDSPALPAQAIASGALRLPISLGSLDFFDIHRSQFVTTQFLSALQQNKLIRYRDINAGSLEGDLALLPEVPDELTYVFELRPDVVWWDRPPTNGRPFRAEDVRLNIERQIAGVDAAGDSDPMFLRQRALAQTDSIDVPDPRVLVFRTAEPNAIYLTRAHAGAWSFFQAPEAWQIFGDRLRDDPLQAAYYTGTGPFQIPLAPESGYVPESRIRLVRNPVYFRDDLPYLQEIELVHLVDPALQEAAYREGRIDAWTPGDPTRIDPILEDLSNQQVQQRPLPFGIQMAFSFRPNPDNPLRDSRIARALHLALDRHLIQEHTYGRFARLSGPTPWFADGWALADEALAALPGYTPELSSETRRTIRGLIAASGYNGPLALTLPDVFDATYPGIGPVLRESLRERIGIDLTVSLASYTRIVEGLGDGSVSVTLGWGDAITDPDPTANLLETVHSAGVRNLGGFANNDVDAALERLQRTLNRTERRDEFQRTLIPALNAAPSWQVNVAHGIQRTVFPPEVHLPALGFGWDGHHYETAWRNV